MKISTSASLFFLFILILVFFDLNEAKAVDMKYNNASNLEVASGAVVNTSDVIRSVMLAINRTTKYQDLVIIFEVDTSLISLLAGKSSIAPGANMDVSKFMKSVTTSINKTVKYRRLTVIFAAAPPIIDEIPEKTTELAGEKKNNTNLNEFPEANNTARDGKYKFVVRPNAPPIVFVAM